jgi:hypothetical protein
MGYDHTGLRGSPYTVSQLGRPRYRELYGLANCVEVGRLEAVRYCCPAAQAVGLDERA